MQVKELRRAIEEEFMAGDLSQVQQQLIEYEKCCPDDIELVSMKTNYYVQTGNLEQAFLWACQGIRRLPLNADMQYNVACVYELRGDLYDAVFHYYIADYLYEYDGKADIGELDLEAHIEELIQQLEQQCAVCEDVVSKRQQMDWTKNLLELSKSAFGLKIYEFRRITDKIIGKYYTESLYQKRYVGIFKDQPFAFLADDGMDVIRWKAEFLEAHAGKTCVLRDDECDNDAEYLLPIACDQATEHRLCHHNKYTVIVQRSAKHFNYYRIKNNTRIRSTNTAYYGKPIKLQLNPNKKRLVLSVFVDGLSQTILHGNDFKRHMPHTYEYFQKGTIFERAYCAAEWTYPSIINYVTGLSTNHHMIFHNEIDYAMPTDIPTLAEFFQADGYYTAMFGGDWRIIPPYGHARGYDRFVYQHQWAGFKVHEVVSDVINHIDAFQEVNQYVWMSVGDLHNVADDMGLPIRVQKDLCPEYRSYEENGPTSAKQSYSNNKKIQFIRYAAYIDRWLKVLFDYIEDNFKEDEVVISLFADHGQGYLVPTDAHFLAKERANVAFMFRGGDAEGKGRVEEIVSACDYSSIMRTLAGVKIPEIPTDGRTPALFGGKDRRKYAVTESIHPNDPYYAAVFGEHETFFFVNPCPIQTDGRFELGQYEYWLEDAVGTKVEDTELQQKYLEIVLKHIAPILIYN